MRCGSEPVPERDPQRASPSTLASRGQRRLSRPPLLAVEFNGLADYVSLDPEAVEFVLVLPIVADGHRRGALRMAGSIQLSAVRERE
jgi:hypothetical protein